MTTACWFIYIRVKVCYTCIEQAAQAKDIKHEYTSMYLTRAW